MTVKFLAMMIMMMMIADNDEDHCHAAGDHDKHIMT